jgi:undecaprenyl-diphosphatase
VFADGGQWVAAVLALCWAAAVVHAEAVRRGRLTDPATRNGVLAALGVAVLLFGIQTTLGDRIDDTGRGATRLDAAVWSAALHDRTPRLTAVAEVLNVAGGMLVLGVLALLASAALLWRGHRVQAALMASAPAAGGLLDLGFKLGYARPRPPESGHLVEVTGFSLPSGHTLDATIVLGTLALVATGLLRRRVARVAVVVVATLAIAMAGAGRVYLGVHWATDVLTGWLLGGAWLAVCVALVTMTQAGDPVPVAGAVRDRLPVAGAPGTGAVARRGRVAVALGSARSRPGNRDLVAPQYEPVRRGRPAHQHRLQRRSCVEQREQARDPQRPVHRGVAGADEDQVAAVGLAASAQAAQEVDRRGGEQRHPAQVEHDAGEPGGPQLLVERGAQQREGRVVEIAADLDEEGVRRGLLDLDRPAQRLVLMIDHAAPSNCERPPTAVG